MEAAQPASAAAARAHQGPHSSTALRECSAGGGSDANFLVAQGLPVLDGIGAVGAGAHSRDEHIVIDATIARTALIAAVVHTFALTDASRKARQ